MATTNSPDPRDGEQAKDDAFRDKLLGARCFCGAKFDDRRNTEIAPGITLTINSLPCRPLRCLAHGYCETHLTSVSAQMTDDDKVRLAKRCGVSAAYFASGAHVP